jgi:uncharacterized protein involved in exopolysaccharide biosynthesis
MPPLPASNPEQALFRVDLRRSLQMHWRLALVVALGGVALAVCYFLRLWPVYIAESLVYVQPSTPKVLDQGGPMRWPFDGGTYETYILQQMQNVTRTDVLTNALHKLSPGTWQGSNESDQVAAERLKRAVEVTRMGAVYQFSIGVRASKPEVAAELANAVTSSFIESATREQKAGYPQRLAILREEQERIQNQLAADRTEQNALNKQLGVASVGNAAPDLIDEDIGRTRAELVTARTKHDEAAAQFAAMDAGKGYSSAAIDAEADGIVSTDAGLASMKTSLNQRRAALITQMANLTPNHPQYQQDAVELTKINGELDAMMKDLRGKAVERIQQRLRTNLEQTAGVEAKMNGQLRQLVGVAGGATSKMQRANDLATDITRLQGRFANVDEQLHNLMLEDGAPGSVYLTTAAVPPLQPAKSGVIRNTGLFALASILFGMLAAVAAHKLDPRIYIAVDLEQVLGVVPMSQLPDFTEVSDEVAEEHMLRLSAAIEHARQQGNLKNCIFTGTASGSGVTTVVTRVRDMLDAMGRATVLVDASGTPVPAEHSNSSGGNGVSQSATERGSQSTALLQHVTEESESREESLVLTDTAPLTISAETEYLARFVDCAIVVVESGVTTRAQLRTTAKTLQRLNVASVGFVLNRIGMAKADPAFRHSMQAAEKHLRSQSNSTARQTVRSWHFAEESAPASEESVRDPSAVAQREPVVPQAAADRRTSAAVAERPATQATQVPPQQSTAQAQRAVLPVPQPESDTPWWLSEKPVHFDASYTAAFSPQEQSRAPEATPVAKPVPPAFRPEPQMPPARTWEDASSGHDDFFVAKSAPIAQTIPKEKPLRDEEEAPNVETSRLSGLRGLLFNLSLNNLDKAGASAPQEAVSLPPQKTVLPKRETAVEHTASGQAFVPFPEPASTPANAADGDAARRVTAQPEFLPPKPAKGKEDVWGNEGKGHRDRRDPYDEVEILPSWRGQYKKRD